MAEKHRNWLSQSVLIVISMLLCACATSSGAPSGPKPNIPGTATLGVVSKGVEEDLEARFDRNATASSAADGAALGAGAGMTASLACGPFFVLCALGTIPVGALAGAATGAIVGANEDRDMRPPEDDLEQLEAILEQLAEQRTIHLEIRDATAARIPVGRKVPGREADALVEVRLSDIRFQESNQGYYWLLQVNVTAQWNRNQGRRFSGKDQVRVWSPSHPLDHWIDADGSTISAALDQLVDDAAEQIANRLF